MLCPSVRIYISRDRNYYHFLYPSTKIFIISESSAFLFFLIPVALYIFDQALLSAASYQSVIECLQHPLKGMQTMLR